MRSIDRDLVGNFARDGRDLGVHAAWHAARLVPRPARRGEVKLRIYMSYTPQSLSVRPKPRPKARWNRSKPSI